MSFQQKLFIYQLSVEESELEEETFLLVNISIYSDPSITVADCIALY